MSNKGKIIQVCAIDRNMHKLLGELNRLSLKAGYRVIGVCSKGSKSKEIENDGIELMNIDIDRKISPLSNIKSIYQMYKIFKREKPDIVHVHTPIAAVLGRIAAKLAKVPNIIYTAHGFYFHENMRWYVYKLFLNIEKYIGRYFTDYIFTQSEEDKQTAIKYNFMKDKSKIICIGNGVDINKEFNPKYICKSNIDKLYKELDITKDDIVVSFVGRLVKEKGIIELLEAFSNINESIKLLVIGDVFEGERDLDTVKKIEKYKYNSNIIFTGLRDDINNLLYISDIFCLPSYREGMPRSIIEAMAMKCAVIATDIRGCREEIVQDETGYLIPVKSVDEIEQKIKYIVNNKLVLDRMKENGRKRAELLYDEKKIVQKQIDIYDDLVKNKAT